MSQNPPAAASSAATSWWPPHAKVVAGTLAGAVVTIGVWALSYFAHVTQPPEVIGAEVVLVSTLVAYLVPGAES